MSLAIFGVLSALLLLSALCVVFLRQPLYSAFALVANMLLLAVAFAQLEAHFLAVSQVIVYAGAIMVLVVFVIMLLSLDGQERQFNLWAVLGSLGVAGAFAWICKETLAKPDLLISPAMRLKAQQDPVVGGVEAVGEHLFTNFLFPFEFASILILAALVGAVVLAKRVRQNDDSEQRSVQALELSSHDINKKAA